MITSRFRGGLQFRAYSSRKALRLTDFHLEHKIHLAKLLTRHAQAYSTDADFFSRESVTGALETIVSAKHPDTRKILDLVTSHPGVDIDQLHDILSGDRLLANRSSENSAIARNTFSELASQTRQTKVRSRFIHADLLLKRDSKQQVTFLVDTTDLKAGPFSNFLLCPIDSAVVRSSFSKFRSNCDSLVIHRLAESLMNELPISISCDHCGMHSTLAESDLIDFACPEDTPAPPPLGHHILNPGGGRTYFGPIVPNLRNVWVGSMDKISHKRGERIAIAIATVFQILKDPSAVRSKKIQLPSPDPLVQWTILPYQQPSTCI